MPLSRSSSGHLYHVLDLPSDATPADVKKAYHKKALLYHPDKTGGSTTEQFKAIQEANAILSDPEKRRLYDMVGRAGLAKLEQYDMHNMAGTVLASPLALVGVLGIFLVFFLLLLLFVLLACYKLDHQKTNWPWKLIFLPLFIICALYLFPIGFTFLYDGSARRHPRVLFLGLFLILQSLTLFFTAGSLDVESGRFRVHEKIYKKEKMAELLESNPAKAMRKSFRKADRSIVILREGESPLSVLDGAAANSVIVPSISLHQQQEQHQQKEQLSPSSPRTSSIEDDEAPPRIKAKSKQKGNRKESRWTGGSVASQPQSLPEENVKSNLADVSPPQTLPTNRVRLSDQKGYAPLALSERRGIDDSDEMGALPRSSNGNRSPSSHRISSIDEDGQTRGADRRAFRSWRKTFVVEALAMFFYVLYALSSSSVEDVKQQMRAENEEDPEVIEGLNAMSSEYISTLARKFFSLGCTLTFFILLGLRLCGVFPTLNFYIVFAPIYASIGLLPLLYAARLLLCWSGAAILTRLCGFVVVLFSVYLSMFTFLLLSEKLQRTYNPSNSFSFLSLFWMFQSGDGQRHLDSHPPPSALLTMSLVLIGLSIICAVLMMAVCVIWGSADNSPPTTSTTSNPYQYEFTAGNRATENDARDFNNSADHNDEMDAGAMKESGSRANNNNTDNSGSSGVGAVDGDDDHHEEEARNTNSYLLGGGQGGASSAAKGNATQRGGGRRGAPSYGSV